MKNLPFKPEVIKDVVREVSKGKGADVNLKALEGGAAAA
jgi:indolepyruvate ferredoxin oxidoreductase beta subunit